MVEMGRRGNYGALFVGLLLLLLNYECSCLRFVEDTNSYERETVHQANLEANTIPDFPKNHTPYSPVPKTGTFPGRSSPVVKPNNTTSNSNNSTQTPPNNTSSEGKKKKWVYFVVLPAAGLLAGSCLVFAIWLWRKKGVTSIRPWRTGLSGPLQHAFITGVPKLNRPELEAACEEFSNIIVNYPEYTVFKGTLSSGVEISVASTAVKSAGDWSNASEICFRRKIETLTRINHKNFVNLLGYCEEEIPFTRMMVFEYAPNGSLFEHLHVEGNEPLQWFVRMRIIMGIAYYLQYIHELEPSIAHPHLDSSLIFLTEDLAAKVADTSVWKEVIRKEKALENENSNFSRGRSVHVESNVYSFGILLLEIITGRLPYSDDEFSLLNMAVQCKKETGSITALIDPALKSHKPEELDAIWEAIQECTILNPQRRPKMRQVISKLNQVLAISPEIASPRHSPLWWAEVEILSA